MERWNDRGAAIIPFGNNIILMRRERGYGKNKQIYYTIPGGGREDGEKIDETTIREMKEELGIEVEIVELMYKLDTVRRMQYIFLGKYVSGKLGTGEGEEFQDVDYNKYGKYIPEVVSLEKLKRIKLVPINLKREIIKEYNYIIGKTNKRSKKGTRLEPTYQKDRKRTHSRAFTDKLNKKVNGKAKVHLETYNNLVDIDSNVNKELESLNDVKHAENKKFKTKRNFKTKNRNINSSKKGKNTLEKNNKINLEKAKGFENKKPKYKFIKKRNSNWKINKENKNNSTKNNFNKKNIPNIKRKVIKKHRENIFKNKNS